MKILIVSSYLPFPLTNGGHIRLFNLIKQLSMMHEITLVCEMRQSQTKEDISEIKKYCKQVITAPRKKQWSIRNIIKSGLSNKSFLVTGHTNDILRNQIKELLVRNTFDVIHVETFYVMHNILKTRIPLLLVEHNIEYLVYKRFADQSSLLIRPLLNIDVYKLRKNELDAWKRSSKLITVSQEEKDEMKKAGVVVVPNGVDLLSFPFNKPSTKNYHSMARHLSLPEKELLFIGDFKWIQNRDSVQWIIRDIWPYLLRAVGDEIKIKLRIVGKNIPDNIKKLNTYDSISFDENAPKETHKIFKKSDHLLAPIRIGGGTSFKILEAMASGVPVVTTKRGIKGFEDVNDNHILVAENTQDIVDKTARLLRDEQLYAHISANARKLIEDKYNWEAIARRLDAVYHTLKVK